MSSATIGQEVPAKSVTSGIEITGFISLFQNLEIASGAETGEKEKLLGIWFVWFDFPISDR